VFALLQTLPSQNPYTHRSLIQFSLTHLIINVFFLTRSPHFLSLCFTLDSSPPSPPLFTLSPPPPTPHLQPPLPLFSLSLAPSSSTVNISHFVQALPPRVYSLVALRSFNCSSIYNSLPFLSHQSLFRLPPLNLSVTLPQSLSLSFSLFLLFFSFSYLNHSTPLPQQQPKVSRFYFYFLLPANIIWRMWVYKL
jgi:hypothetical protein